ncbi:RNA-guided endonuclease InsQ/TnpB family protein [Aneurinibacillus uraniidurans]|uniref:RNA-guided endonuclease InsQ/TnpB family protein n=1 Tax=Aneurinibacillus uraniidurans TaxID=2966586 RepID=UPI00234B9B17|nr:RNA-guided endonuclease TnpB family protein [Aneurinibacillus sp. B1]WCN36894.1 RNA-guided endonuclease TnpB family protein [Aneurinibacillus sp. B1]
MLRGCKTEIYPTPEQVDKINRTIGTCRFIYNLYLSKNKVQYEKDKTFLTANDFSKLVNHDISKQDEYKWIKEVSSKAVKQAMVNGEKAFKKFFKGLAKYPRSKKKKNQDVKAYFPKNNKTDWAIERHRIKIPTLGWVRLKEKGYIPVNATVRSGTVSQKAGRYFVSVLVEIQKSYEQAKRGDGIGIDVGVSDFVIASDGQIFGNLNKTSAVRRTEKRLKRAQRALSRKYEQRKRGETSATYRRSNIRKAVLRVQALHMRLANMRSAYRSYVVSMLVKTKPAFITLEKLNIKGMVKNRHVARAVSNQGFYDFKLKLLSACRKYGIEVREVSTFYPSSKLCSCCGHKKVQLSLRERTFICENCGTSLDRDFNASLNLKQATEYTVVI